MTELSGVALARQALAAAREAAKKNGGATKKGIHASDRDEQSVQPGRSRSLTPLQPQVSEPCLHRHDTEPAVAINCG
ncbi:hypothetical protein ACIRU8_43060 [Streptomyces sp. NPDC101175]|uniref:hypothetical protein n=1 Tax=Streptomyces sp. NPDC101175 TaxID=3366123 RepID=UPI003838DAA6